MHEIYEVAARHRRYMHLWKSTIVVFLVALTVGVAPALARDQEQEPDLLLGPQFEQRFQELAKWVRAYYAWEEWFELWGNRVARNSADLHVWDRKKRPEPPVWLEQECQDYLDDGGLLGSACAILRNWDEQPIRILLRPRSSLVTSGGSVDDKVVKSSFFRRVHLTGLWLRARYPVTPVYGIVGMQVAVFEVGRYTLPAVGVMMVMLRDADGGYAWKPATTVGFGYRLSDFMLPLINKPASLHVNVARASVHGVQDETIAGSLNYNFFGLSVSGKARR